MVSSGHEYGSTAYRRILIALFFAGVAAFAQLYAPQSLLVAISDDFQVSAAQSALVISVSTVAVAISVVPWALLAGRIGRARAMSIAVSAAALLGCLVPFSPTFETLLVGRFVEGLAVGAIPAIAMAYLSGEIVASHSPRAAGAYVAGTALGGLSGRVVAGPIADATDWRVAMLVVAVTCAIAALAFVLLVPPQIRRHRDSIAASVRRFGRVMRRPWLLVALAHPFLLMGAFVAMYNYVGFRLEAPPFALSATIVSALFFAYLAGTWSSSRAGAWTQRFGRIPTLLSCVGTVVVGVLLTIPPSLPLIVLGVVLVTAGFFAAHAVVGGWVPVANADAAGEASALYSLSFYVGSSVVGWAIGLIYGGSGWTSTALVLAALSVAAAAAAAIPMRARGATATGESLSRAPETGRDGDR
jgi:predicted MFS family arabinose efflux permease